MTDHVLERRLWLPRPRPEVFEFFAEPRNLERIQPAGANLRWLAAPPAGLAAGTVLDFRLRTLGMPTRWRVLVREFDRPYRFVDVQLWGPFARWEHRHTFAEGPGPEGAEAPAGTWVEDRITYRLPWGPLGHLAHALAAGRHIKAVFDHRDQRLRELFPPP